MDAHLNRAGYVGLFIVASSALMYEILLTRIFSVTMWYHFAFMVISIAMFGLTVGAVCVYLYPKFFPRELTKYHLSLYSLLFSVSMVASFVIQLYVPFSFPSGDILSLSVVANWLFCYFIISVPFIFGGICTCLALTRFPMQLSKLYAADLAGAAAGCILIIVSLETTDAPTTLIFIAIFACTGALFFLYGEQFRRLTIAGLFCLVSLSLLAAGHSWFTRQGAPLLQIKYVKGALEPPSLYEKWNSFSRVKVFGDPDFMFPPFGWGLSPKPVGDTYVRQLWLNIDAHANTILTKFDGDIRAVSYLKCDVTNMAHWIKPNADVLVIGAGGGRDLLSALVFDQKSVLGVEMNPAIVSAVNGPFGEFSGHLDRHPKIRFVVDEARSYVARENDRFDIIQISLTDTWAATAAGAFVLTENSLYTLEGWKIFLEHLTPEGIIAVSRGSAAENYRVASLARAALLSLGVTEPENHIAVVKFRTVATTLTSRSPLSAHQLDTLEKVSKEMGFKIAYSPRGGTDKFYPPIVKGENTRSFEDRHLIDLTPPTDDKPFFFHMLRPADFFRFWTMSDNLGMGRNAGAVQILLLVIIVVTILTGVFILLPIFAKAGLPVYRKAAPFMVFFAGIGLGFMFVEISQLQRFNIFLGHPSYSLSVVLFTLLLSCGLGSYLTWKVDTTKSFRPAAVRLAMLLGALLFFGILTPKIIETFQASATEVRVLIAVGILSPLGLFMGMAFPLGMSVASRTHPNLAPWLWGVNGATSVCGSVLALGVALFFGISAAFWIGACCYVVSGIALYFSISGKQTDMHLAQVRI